MAVEVQWTLVSALEECGGGARRDRSFADDRPALQMPDWVAAFGGVGGPLEGDRQIPAAADNPPATYPSGAVWA
jgi:hypothetical protein